MFICRLELHIFPRKFNLLLEREECSQTAAENKTQDLLFASTENWTFMTAQRKGTKGLKTKTKPTVDSYLFH